MTDTNTTGGGYSSLSEAVCHENHLSLERVRKARTDQPHPEVHSNARDYMAKAGLPFDESPIPYGPLDQNVARQTAQTYEQTPHDPNHPEVQKAFKNETLGQFKHLQSRGVKLEPWTSEGQPYKNSNEMVHDVHNNRHLGFFVGGDMPQDHPLAEKTGINLNGHDLTYNDAFRAVHDYYGHAAYGNEFGPRGEEHAFNSHKRMYSPEAQPAMAFETKGQNSWVNFGPHSHLPVTQRPYAQQKANLLKLARKALGKIRKARQPHPEVTELLNGFHKDPSWGSLQIVADKLEERGHPASSVLRDPQELAKAWVSHYLKRNPGADPNYQERVTKATNWPIQDLVTGNKTPAAFKTNNARQFLHSLTSEDDGGPIVPISQRLQKARSYETPEEREHREAEEALSTGGEPTKELIGKLKPGTKKEIGGKQYLRSMDGPYELTAVDPNSFGYRPQKYRNQAIIDKYREQIKRAVAAGKSPQEAVEPVQGEPFQRDDILGGQMTNYLRDGNHRTDAAIAEGLKEIPAWFPMRKARLLKLARKVLGRIRKARPADWDQMTNHWLSQGGFHGSTLGILGDYLEENGNPNHATLRDPQAFQNHYQDWYWKKYPKGLDYNEDTRAWEPTQVDMTRGQIAARRKSQTDAITPQVQRLWQSGTTSYAKPSTGHGSLSQFLSELPDLQQPPPPVAKRTRKPKAPPTQLQRMARKVLDRIRKDKGSNQSSPPVDQSYISVPEPLTTAQHQHWLDYNLKEHEKPIVERSPQLGKHIQEVAPMSEVLHSTIAGRHGRHWYDENHDILKAATHHSSDPRDFTRLAALEAATSPNNGILPNQQAAYDLFRIWHMGASVNGRHIKGRSEDHKDIKDLLAGYGAGEMDYPPDYKVPELRGQPLMRKGPHPKPNKQNGGIAKFIHTGEGWTGVPIYYHGGGTGAHSFLAFKALAHPETLADPNRVGGFTTYPEKADSFLRNKLGNQDAVTIDRHEARGYGYELGSKRPDGSKVDLSSGLYHFLAATGRHAARLLNHPEYNTHNDHPIYGQGWTGARGQAARWMTMRGIRDAIQKGATPEQAALGLKARDIYNTSSFVHMFRDPTLRSRIKTMMAEGSLSPDFMDRVKGVEATYKPDDKELDQSVGHHALVPLARKVAYALRKQHNAMAADKREALERAAGKSPKPKRKTK